MNWSNVKLILAREVRDQFRDRRTLFMIAVLPLFLYPLLGMSFFQISQFMQEHPTKVFVIGWDARLDRNPALFENGRFAANLFASPDKVRLLELEFAPEVLPSGETAKELLDRARRQVNAGEYDAVLRFPPDFVDQLEKYRQASMARVVNEASGKGGPDAAARAKLPQIPQPDLIVTSASEKSGITADRLYGVFRRWSEDVGRSNLSSVGLSPIAARPVEIRTADLAEERGTAKGSIFWAKMLPVMLLLWAMTGAFYPAVDLCAGEKERGTLETLLSSPAERSEIVVGKLVTIMLFSMITAILNLVSMGLTGWLIMSKMPGIGIPSPLSIVWLLVALVPISALFSALCLALAALARSTKEGQYYLMPLMLVCMPLAVLPMAPGVELNLGNSLIPVSNVVLLLRTLLEGDYAQALKFAGPVIGITMLCCLLAIRWAVDQFNQESVLFRESERLDLGLWFHHLFQDRKPTPNVAMALFGGMLFLMIRFFMTVSTPAPAAFTYTYLVKTVLITQFAVIVLPTMLMSVMLTTSPARTFMLDRTASWNKVIFTLPAAIALAIVLNPVVVTIAAVISTLYPMDTSVEVLGKIFQDAPPAVYFGLLLPVLAIVPAICEEFAFRGFILSGLRHGGKKWRAIIITAIFFGASHFILQQSMVAALVGVVLGYIAVQSGNLLPCIAYHMVHNSLFLLMGRITPKVVEDWPILEWMFGGTKVPSGGLAMYTPSVVIVCGVLAAMILTWFSRLPYQKTREEKIQDAIRRGIDAEDEPLGSTVI